MIDIIAGLKADLPVAGMVHPGRNLAKVATYLHNDLRKVS